MMEKAQDRPASGYSAAEIGALAHLYRGEMYQSKIWRNRLDTTSNWAVVITGIALSVSFSHAEASPIPILLVSWVAAVSSIFKSHQYLYYDLFRVRVRVIGDQLLRPDAARPGDHYRQQLGTTCSPMTTTTCASTSR